MPNRIIKESICTSNEIETLTPEQEILFYRIIVNCDDYGRMDARLPILRAKCFPLRIDKIKDKDIQGWLDALIKQGLIYIYAVDGKQYLQMTTWEKHQQVRAKRSKFPAPDNGVITSDINGNQMQSDVPENPIQSESKRSSKVFDDDSLEMRMAKYMAKRIKETYPGAKPPDLNKWCQTFNRLMRLDGRTPKEIGQVMEWVYQDDFWSTNIRSPDKLREKWDTLWLQMHRKHKQDRPNKPIEQWTREEREAEGI